MHININGYKLSKLSGDVIGKKVSKKMLKEMQEGGQHDNVRYLSKTHSQFSLFWSDVVR